MSRLFSYCLRYDSGIAPNPFWGVCTLVICKPAIRRDAQVGDWIAGTGSKKSPIGDVSGMLVFAMEVTRVMTMKAYDGYTQNCLPEKVPDLHHRDMRLRLGDSNYDFSTSCPSIRPGPHGRDECEPDWSGRNALLSEHFYYFGDQPIPLPEHLRPIVHQRPGHRSTSNEPYKHAFVKWFLGLRLERNAILGDPQNGPCSGGLPGVEELRRCQPAGNEKCRTSSAKSVPSTIEKEYISHPCRPKKPGGCK